MISPVIYYSRQPFPPYQINYISENVTRIMGYEPDQLIGGVQTWEDHIHHDDRLMLSDEIDKVFRLGEASYQYRFLRSDGCYRWVQEDVILGRDQVGAITEISGYFRDVTDRRESFEALRKSEERYRSLAEAAHDFIFVLSRDDIVEYVNSFACKALGIKAEEVIGRPRSILFPENIFDSQLKSINNTLRSGQPCYFEGLAPFGSHEIWLGTWLVPLLNDRGECSSILGVSRDIDGRRQAEQGLRNALQKEKELNDLRSSFISRTTHEFLTPLSTILSSAELLEYYGHRWPEEKKVTHLHRIQDATKNMSQMLGDILTIERIETRKLECAPEKLDLVQLCGGLVDEIKSQGDGNHRVALLVPSENKLVRMDGKLVRQVISNLLANAMKYSKGGTKVTIELMWQADDAVISIQDKGIGIPEQDQKVLYEPFVRGSNVSGIPGTGLGLTIVKKSVELMGGEIHLKSELNVGTIFTVRLPVEQAYREE
ncbi:MAG: PAS domain-containing sensor histidine kinase [Anaerolineaceae bacterium]|nr:PAS domain-containing sensor histidine kinase [Anaerolineaceae bacterium]